MNSSKNRLTLGLAVSIALLSATALWAQPISVRVDGEMLQTAAPPREVGGRVLVGMADIFRRLGATVEWNGAEKKITATRGSRVIVLWIGRQYATIDGTAIPLDVPPMLIGGYTYVPVRFPAEALGADVTWLSATRTVMISTEKMPPIDDEGPPPPPPPPPPPAQARGVLLQIVAATPRVIVIRPYDSTDAQGHTATPAAVFQRGDAEATVLRVVAADELLPGDDVVLFLNAERQVERVEARYAIEQVEFAAAAANKLMTQAGQVYSLSSDVKVTRTDTGEINLADIAAGEQIMLRVNPESQIAWEITAPPGEAPPPPPDEEIAPQILMIAPEGYTRPLRQREVLHVRMQGTAGGQATFDIGDAHTGIEMTENPAGVYRGEYRVARNEETINAVIRGHLVVDGTAAQPVDAEDRVSLDAVSPTVTEHLPAQGQALATDRPTIQCTYDDGEGTGVDPNSVRLAVAGTDVTASALITETALTYYSPALAEGEVSARLTATDGAGNPVEQDWSFLIRAEEAPSAISSVTHVPPGAVLGEGDTLTVMLQAEPRGRGASFDIEGFRADLPMTRQGGPASRTWEGSYDVKVGDLIRNARIVGHFVDRNGTSHSLEDQQRVTINARVRTRLAVTSPTDGAQVPEVFNLEGTCVPTRKVYYDVGYEGRSKLGGIEVTGRVTQGYVKVADDGTWSVEIDTGPIRRNLLLRSVESFQITCTLRGQGDKVVEQVDLTVTP